MIRRMCITAAMLATLTLFVGCSLFQLAETETNSQISNAGHGKTIFGNADSKPYPLKQFDADRDSQIDDSEFIRVIDAWFLNLIDEETFPEGIDVWVFGAILVNEEDNSRELALESGGLLTLALESNPSTGFRWEVTELNEIVLQPMGESKWQPYDPKSVLPGSGGWEIFHFRAEESGKAALKLAYHRSWETGVEPLETFTVQVTVR